MSRTRRNRARRDRPAQPVGPLVRPQRRDHVARIHVDDHTWTTYRVALGGTPVSVALGKLVEREVARHRRMTADDADGVRRAVQDAKRVADELSALIARLDGPS